MTVEWSPTETQRFGHRVARLGLNDLSAFDPASIAESDFDIVIVRSPSQDLAGATLAAVPGYTAIHADTLMYWERSINDDKGPGIAVEIDDLTEVADLIRTVFTGYSNHYLANPLFEPRGAVEGYAEWGTNLVAAGRASTLGLRDRGTVVAFALVEWTSDPPDIKLAGVIPGHHGQGWYTALLKDVLQSGSDRGSDRLLISTQSHNVAVQRAWARLGFLPLSSQCTTHLVRTELLRRGHG